MSRANQNPLNPGRAARIDEIMIAMESGAWEGESSHQPFAIRFGVSPLTIRNDANDAGMLLRRATTDDEVKAWADIHLSDLTDLARGDKDYSNARGAIRDRLDARGLLVSKQQVSVALERVSDPEILKAALLEICATDEGRKLLLEKAREIQAKETP